MRIYHSGFLASLQAARDGSIAPAWFLWTQGRDRATGAARTLGLWSGDEAVTLAVENPEGGTDLRSYVGGCNLAVEDLKSVADLTDNPVTVSLSQIADAAQLLVRGFDIRMAHAEIHATSWTGGALASVPQLMWVGIVDEGPVSTPAAGGEGQIALTIRSEIMSMLTAQNPAKSSDEHQKRRQPGDRFSEYSGVIASRKIDWYKS